MAKRPKSRPKPQGLCGWTIHPFFWLAIEFLVGTTTTKSFMHFRSPFQDLEGWAKWTGRGSPDFFGIFWTFGLYFPYKKSKILKFCFWIWSRSMLSTIGSNKEHKFIKKFIRNWWFLTLSRAVTKGHTVVDESKMVSYTSVGVHWAENMHVQVEI